MLIQGQIIRCTDTLYSFVERIIFLKHDISPLKESHTIQKIQGDHKLPQSLLFTFFAWVYGKFPKYSSVLKILFDIREAREDGDRRDSNLESISKYEKVNLGSF